MNKSEFEYWMDRYYKKPKIGNRHFDKYNELLFKCDQQEEFSEMKEFFIKNFKLKSGFGLKQEFPISIQVKM